MPLLCLQRTGRISIAELANKSNEFIDLSAPEVIELVRRSIACVFRPSILSSAQSESFKDIVSV